MQLMELLDEMKDIDEKINSLKERKEMLKDMALERYNDGEWYDEESYVIKPQEKIKMLNYTKENKRKIPKEFYTRWNQAEAEKFARKHKITDEQLETMGLIRYTYMRIHQKRNQK